MSVTKANVLKGTAAEWAAHEFVLEDGDLAVESDTGKMKEGDGESTFAQLPYVGAAEIDAAKAKPSFTQMIYLADGQSVAAGDYLSPAYVTTDPGDDYDLVQFADATHPKVRESGLYTVAAIVSKAFGGPNPTVTTSRMKAGLSMAGFLKDGELNQASDQQNVLMTGGDWTACPKVTLWVPALAPINFQLLNGDSAAVPISGTLYVTKHL